MESLQSVEFYVADFLIFSACLYDFLNNAFDAKFYFLLKILF